ncbi:collagen alpha-1(II) chain-like [Pocillopora damicornis]|nr:collagen alpha-1(II) chain-like [Pocillopora damicornis]CAH3131049.1 unnamed protein product [Pocillopora meandrina]
MGPPGQSLAEALAEMNTGEKGPPPYRLYSSQGSGKSQDSNNDVGAQLFKTVDIEFMISLLDRKIQTFRVQNGDLEHPARSCREIKLDHPESKSGEYTIDPNEGCSSDAVKVYCDFEKNATCVNPKKTKIVVDANETGPGQWTNEDEPIEYKLNSVQMTYLRLLSKSAFQEMSYSCANSHKSCMVDLKGDNEMVVNNLEKIDLDVTETSDNGNKKMKIEVSTAQQNNLPIVDWAPQSSVDSKLTFEIGPVCFKY